MALKVFYRCELAKPENNNQRELLQQSLALAKVTIATRGVVVDVVVVLSCYSGGCV